MTSETKLLKPQRVASGEGEARWWFNGLAEIKATAEMTGGGLSIVEITQPPLAEVPLHVHHREDESFWILEGEMTVEVDGAFIPAKTGDYIFAPRDIPHRFVVGPNGCRMLFIMTPGGFERLVIGMSSPAEARTLPPPTDCPPDWAHIAAVAREYGNELLG